MIKRADVEIKEKGDFITYISLAKLIGKKIKDIRGYISNEFGDPSFKISWLIFEDDTKMRFEGEHDFPYLTDNDEKQPNFDCQTLRSLDKENEEE